MKEKKIDHWFYREPAKEFDKNGRRSIINGVSFGPLESVDYGVTEDGKYYWENHIIEGYPYEIVDFEYIDKDKMLKTIANYINYFEKNNAHELAQMLNEEMEKLI